MPKPLFSHVLNLRNQVSSTTTAPPSGAAGGDLAGSTYPNPVVAPGAVTTAKLAVGASVAAVVNGTIPANYTTTLTNTFQTVLTLPTITTRGGYVMVCVAAALSYLIGTSGGNIAQMRVLRGASVSGLWRWDLGIGTVGARIPLPMQTYLEAAAPAAYVYVLQVNVFNANGTIISENAGGAVGTMLVAELA